MNEVKAIDHKDKIKAKVTFFWPRGLEALTSLLNFITTNFLSLLQRFEIQYMQSLGKKINISKIEV